MAAQRTGYNSKPIQSLGENQEREYRAHLTAEDAEVVAKDADEDSTPRASPTQR